MILRAGEKVLTTGRAVSITHSDAAGVLYLTTQRLIFETSRSGLFRAGSTSTLLDLPLAAVSDAHVDRPRIRVRRATAARIRFVTPHGEVDFRVDHPEVWRQYLAAAKRAAPPPERPAPSSVTVSVHLPPAGPAAPAPAPVIRVRCPYCRAVYDEALGRCPGCGARFA